MSAWLWVMLLALLGPTLLLGVGFLLVYRWAIGKLLPGGQVTRNGGR